MDNRLIYLKVRKLFKEKTDNLTVDNKHGQKGLTDVIHISEERKHKIQRNPNRHQKG